MNALLHVLFVCLLVASQSYAGDIACGEELGVFPSEPCSNVYYSCYEPNGEPIIQNCPSSDEAFVYEQGCMPKFMVAGCAKDDRADDFTCTEMGVFASGPCSNVYYGCYQLGQPGIRQECPANDEVYVNEVGCVPRARVNQC